MGIVRKEFTFPGEIGSEDIYACFWADEEIEDYRGIIQIAHGMFEHILRYEDFAVFFVRQGYIVCGNDHLGHGRSAKNKDELGYFGEEEGWKNLISDMLYLSEFMKNRFRGLPYIIIGHSMGSFLAREFIVCYPLNVQGAVFIGTSGGNNFIDIALGLCERGIQRKGSKAIGRSVKKMVLVPFNARFMPARTDYDWICSDNNVVDDYIEDTYRCSDFTYAGYRDLLEILKRVNEDEWYSKVPKDLPMLLISGEEDPVGDFGKGVEKVYGKMTEAGCNKVEMRLYCGLRHEILNEGIKKQIYRYILKWINEF